MRCDEFLANEANEKKKKELIYSRGNDDNTRNGFILSCEMN